MFFICRWDNYILQTCLSLIYWIFYTTKVISNMIGYMIGAVCKVLWSEVLCVRCCEVQVLRIASVELDCWAGVS